jgi:hypothetical protein
MTEHLTFTAITTYMVFDGLKCMHNHKTPEAAETCGNQCRIRRGEQDACLVIRASNGNVAKLYPAETLKSKYPELTMNDWLTVDGDLPLTADERRELYRAIIWKRGTVTRPTRILA